MSPETQTDTQKSPQAGEPVQSDSANITATPRRRFNPVIIGGVVLVLLVVGIGIYLYTSRYETTDDAQVDGHLNPIASRIDGTITAVHADDNQVVQAGTLLVELDPSDDKIAFEQATAQYDQATAQLNASHPNLPITRINNSSDLSSQQAEVQGAEASLAAAQHDLDGAVDRLKESQATDERDQADYLRYKDLNDKQEVARTLYDQARATAEAQTQIVAASVAAVASSQKTVELRASQLAEARSKLAQVQNKAPLQLAAQEADVKGQQANAEATQAALEQSRLNLTYCRIPAPVAGVVTERSAEIGERISKGQQLFMIVQIDDLWVTADFKETQLAKMHPGERVTIHVDALSRDFDGTVESMPAVTGSRTSVLPPENATGNYVKVIQRLPVRIRFNAGQQDLDKLRPGMSVEPKVWLN
jgi:membrane fusion protein (multidrug efflux system)